MADQVGYPFNQIPPQAWVNAGGGYGQASLCGTLGVAAACIGMVCEVDQGKKVLYDLNEWYKTAEFPMYQPEGLDLPHTVANSLLCDESVNIYMEESGYEYGSAERKSRCAGVAADVTRKMVELLNAELA